MRGKKWEFEGERDQGIISQCVVYGSLLMKRRKERIQKEYERKESTIGQQIMVGIIGRKREIIIIHFNDKGKEEEEEEEEVGGEGRGRRVGMIGFLFFFFVTR